MPTPARNVIDQLTALRVKPPKLLLDELAVLDRATAYTPPGAPDLAAVCLAVSEAEIEAAIEAVGDTMTRKAELLAARGDALKYLGMRVDRALAAVADDIQAALGRVFTPAAEAFTDAFRRLPPEWQNAERLVQSTAHVAALIEAKEHVPTLDACRSIYRALPDRPDTPRHHGTAYCTVTDTIVAEEVTRTKSQGPLGYWGNLLATPGVIALHWHKNTAHHTAYLATVEVFEMRQVRENESGFGGHQIRKVRVA